MSPDFKCIAKIFEIRACGQWAGLTVELSGAAMIVPNGCQPKRLRKNPASYPAALPRPLQRRVSQHVFLAGLSDSKLWWRRLDQGSDSYEERL